MGHTMKLAVTGSPHGVWSRDIMGRATRQPLDAESRGDAILLVNDDSALEATDTAGYAAIVCATRLPGSWAEDSNTPSICGADTGHLQESDVISISRTGFIRTVYRVGSRYNVVFATDACNSYCLMCSQPPRKVDPRALIADHLRLLSLIPDVPPELGITGGEPTLLKDGLLEIVAACKARFPSTPLHMLSNGRLFYYDAFARRLADLAHPDLMVGVPIYSDTEADHDHIVQARGAFNQTLIGLQNLGRYGVPVEIRIVVHRLTADHLTDIAAFVYRNLTFAAHVTFMGLEPVGFAVPNLDRLWIDPWDYRDELERATLFLAERGMNVSVYNHQLCTVPPAIRPFCRQSISDWKNDYLPACDHCAARSACAGFFYSATQRRYSSHISPIAAVP
jgi:His-Xaa-Ser system radical SAM maturase HxsC